MYGDFIHLIFYLFSGNEITSIPAELGQLSSLRSLDISKNRVTVLPKQLCTVRTLESVALDADQMKYPPRGKLLCRDEF
jgi:Leucine-rich repeat (LRR) protein